jgi:ABC-type Fe3+-hydroxamate transport system substrate-binding protein
MAIIQTFSDQMGHQVSIKFPPQRIVSLVPSQTELLADLGLDREIVGITKFCVHPSKWITSKTIVGGTKNFQFEKIHELRPDLIIGNKEENDQEGIETLKKSYPVWMSDIVTMEDVMKMIQSVGKITSKIQQAETIIGSIRASFNTLQTLSFTSTVLYLIWRKPWMAAGKNTFINTTLDTIGFSNATDHDRYPELTDDDIRNMKADYIFLSSEPYPFREKHIADLSRISPASRIVLVDGEMFSWYGSRLVKAPDYFRELIARNFKAE